MQGVVEKLNVLVLVEIPVRLADILEVPFVFVAEEDAGLGDDSGVMQHRRKAANLMTHFADFGVSSVLAGAVVGQNAAIKLFRADARLAPKKVEDATGTARNQLVAEE